MNDHFGFTMASVNEQGSVFANPCKGEKNMSTLMYRPFSSWASNSEVRFYLFNILLVVFLSLWKIEIRQAKSSYHSPLISVHY